MNTMKEIVKEMDFFSHSQFFRYRQEENYRTLTGGIISITLIAIFIGIFASLAIDTFNNNIIIDQTKQTYQLDPTYYELKASPQNKFMFAVGINNMDLSSSKRYFDIVLQNAVAYKAGGSPPRTNIGLVPCSPSQWSGVNSAISEMYAKLNLTQWLCPPANLVLPLQGKFTSSSFRYSRILVSACTNSALYPNTTCANQLQVDDFITSNQGVTVNLYFINPLINSGSKEYLDYYLEDANYFTFDKTRGVSANLYFSEYSIKTDHSILPWSDQTTDKGVMANSLADSQTYTISSNNPYAKIYIRKASVKEDITRSFQKLDQTLSFIGGLFGTVMLICVFLSIYDKYAYEIEFGDRLFKQESGGSYGSENFNFIVFLGYGIFNIFAKLGVLLKWHAMKRYHECRMESMKQLDIGLLFKKIELFEQVSYVLLEDFHLRGLHMVPKPSIGQSRKNRKRYLLQSIIYHQLDRKAREIHVQPNEYQKHRSKYLNYHRQSLRDLDEQGSVERQLRKELGDHIVQLQEQSRRGEPYSQKIIEKLGLRDIFNDIVNQSILFAANPNSQSQKVVRNNDQNNLQNLFDKLNTGKDLVDRSQKDKGNAFNQ